MGLPTIDLRNTNTVWCSVIAETLARLGVTHAVISPGSRSTALTLALVRHPGIETLPVLDERSAAFFALGLARRLRQPVALVCTSGTAGANYFPAVIEAHESGVPLLLLTADRPPELRACHSGQTIDQQKLFGAFVKAYHELCVPEATMERLQYLRQTLVNACDRARGPFPGPVHLNAPFRDPLAPIGDETARSLQGRLDEDFFAHLDRAVPASRLATFWQRANTVRGLIVAGPASPQDPAAYARAVGALAVASGWPILADALSTLRTHRPESPAAVVTTYDLLLRNETTAKALMPRQVLCLGSWPTSKVLRAFIERSQAEILLVSPTEDNRDALHGRTRQIVAPVESLAIQGAPFPDDSYANLWKRGEQMGRERLDTAMAEAGGFEGKAAWLLAKCLPVGTPLFVSGSMPVRDVEYFWPANGGEHAFAFNRGANGIDGTLSTALGLAHGNRPSVLLTGDLALLHDSNGGLIAPRLKGSLTIVLINNRGGGIFEHLPIAAFDPPFEEYFATPQAVEFSSWAKTYGIEHVAVRDWSHLESLARTLPTEGVRVWEIRTDRKADAAYRKKLFSRLATEIGHALAV